MGGSGGGAEAPDVVGAARVEAEARRRAAQEELWANRPDQSGPMGSTTWDSTMIDSSTGRPVAKDKDGNWQFADHGDVNRPPRPSNLVPAQWPETGWVHNGVDNAETRAEWDAWRAWHDNVNGAGGPEGPGGSVIDPVSSWEQTTSLTPEWQEILEGQQDLINQQTGFRSDMINDWSDNPLDYGDIGGDNLSTTIGRGDLGQFGQNAPNMGAQDWRQFGTTDQTIGAGQWQNQGNTQQTIGADDWRQFGTTGQTVGSGDWDARFGNNDQSGGFGDHSMEGGGWDTVQYTPEALRNKAEQQTLDFMNSQLDPQWDSRQSDLEIKLTNQGLQPGDAAWDNAMASMSKNRDFAYSGARNQALADSRAEASMLWNQEMGRSEQKNMQHQADVDNIFRARQSNIQNYQGQRATDMAGYLNYQNSAFDQDYRSRQQQIDSNLDYGNSAFGQDLQARQQRLNAQLDYGREAFGQDFQSRQQQLDANRMYSSEAFNQDLQSRQANISNYLNYGNAEFNQNLTRQQLDLQARIEQERLAQGRYGLVNPNETIGTVTDALS